MASDSRFTMIALTASAFTYPLAATSKVWHSAVGYISRPQCQRYSLIEAFEREREIGIGIGCRAGHCLGKG